MDERNCFLNALLEMSERIDFLFLSRRCHFYSPGPARAVLTRSTISPN
jgi:hypothetical protein